MTTRPSFRAPPIAPSIQEPKEFIPAPTVKLFHVLMPDGAAPLTVEQIQMLAHAAATNTITVEYDADTEFCESMVFECWPKALVANPRYHHDKLKYDAAWAKHAQDQKDYTEYLRTRAPDEIKQHQKEIARLEKLIAGDDKR